MKSILWIAAVICLLAGPARSDSIDSVLAAEIEDTWLNNALPTLNYGTHNGTLAGYGPESSYLVKIKNLQTSLGWGKFITGATFSIYNNSADGVAGNRTVGLYRMFKPVVAGTLDGQVPPAGAGATHALWDGSKAWTKVSSDSASDNGLDNEGNGTGADRAATPMSTVLIAQNPVEGYRAFPMSVQIVNGWYNGNIVNNGLIMKYYTASPGWGWTHFLTADYATVSQRPFFIFTLYDMQIEHWGAAKWGWKSLQQRKGWN